MSRTNAVKRVLTIETLYVVLTLLTLGIAFLLVRTPDLIDPSIADQLLAFAEPELLPIALTGGALILGGYLFWLLATSQRDDVVATETETSESSSSDTHHVTGAATTAQVTETIDALERGEGGSPESLRHDLIERFETLATEIGYTTAETEELLATGDWTDNETAALFLGSPNYGEYDFLARLRGWLFPGRTFERRYDLTLTAIETFLTEAASFETSIHDRGATNQHETDSIPTLRTAGDRQQWHARWHGAVFISLVFVTAGIFFAESTLFFVALLPLGFVGYAALARSPDPASTLAISREPTTTHPLPGEPVDITLTIENTGTAPLTDIRVVDGVPDALTVTEGVSSAGFALRAGESRTLQYRVRPQRGTHVFDATVVRLRSLSGAAIATAEITSDGPASLQCAVPIDSVPVHRETIQRVGSVPTDRGGPGLEFHSTREYRHGDPPRWIDWRRYARTGELGTIRYRRQEATTVVAMIDGREAAAFVDQPGTPDGVTLSVYAGILSTGTLLDAGHQVGLLGLGVRVDGDDVYSGPPVYVPPGEAGVHSARIADVCDTIADPATIRGNPLDPGPIDVDRIHSLLPQSAQLLVVSPLLDDEIVDAVSALRRRGFDITVLSPDITRRDAYGTRLHRLDRTRRRLTLTKLGIPVIDWNPDDRLHLTLDRLAESSILVTQ